MVAFHSFASCVLPNYRPSTSAIFCWCISNFGQEGEGGHFFFCDFFLISAAFFLSGPWTTKQSHTEIKVLVEYCKKHKELADLTACCGGGFVVRTFLSRLASSFQIIFFSSSTYQTLQHLTCSMYVTLACNYFLSFVFGFREFLCLGVCRI